MILVKISLLVLIERCLERCVPRLPLIVATVPVQWDYYELCHCSTVYNTYAVVQSPNNSSAGDFFAGGKKRWC